MNEIIIFSRNVLYLLNLIFNRDDLVILRQVCKRKMFKTQ